MKLLHKFLAGLCAMGLTVAAPLASALADEEEEAAVEGSSQDEIADDDASAIVVFRDRLSPYGTWTVHPDYGTVWIPSSRLVGADFSPYVTSGHWELTPESDWLWVSDYDWGYIPFHYGRWIWIEEVGWSWVPGRVYAPSWVVFRTGDEGYIGWAPAPPEWYWIDGIAVSLWSLPIVSYTFCHTTHVFHHHVHTYVIHDRTGVEKAGRATRPYVPARPHRPRTAGHNTPRSGHGPTRGPSMEEAHIDKANAPKLAGKHDPKATEFMKPEAIAKSKALPAATKKVSASGPSRTMNASPATRGAGVGGYTQRIERGEASTVERTSAPRVNREAPRGEDDAPRFDRAGRDGGRASGTESSRAPVERTKPMPRPSRDVDRDERAGRTQRAPSFDRPTTSPAREARDVPRTSRSSRASAPRSTPRVTPPSSRPSAPSQIGKPKSTPAPKATTPKSSGKTRSKR